jgi:putative transposon-encoded protein
MSSALPMSTQRQEIASKVNRSMKNEPSATKPEHDTGEDVLTHKEKTPKAKFEIYAEEMIEKEVRPSGKSGRIYLPPEWVGKHVKVIRLD